MYRYIHLILAILFFIFFTVSVVGAIDSTRYASCDACGLCPTIDVAAGTCTVSAEQVPGDWRSCAKCLYGITPPGASELPGCDTLAIDEATNASKQLVVKGRQFTMLGCITSGTNVGFEGGAPSFVQAMLNVIFSLSGGIAFLYLMYGGFIILTSQADAEQLNYGKRLITGSIVGISLTISSVFLVNLIGSGILKIPGFSGTVSP